jgi:hypothetical protein
LRIIAASAGTMAAANATADLKRLNYYLIENLEAGKDL